LQVLKKLWAAIWQCCSSPSKAAFFLRGQLARNILEVIHALSNDEAFTPSQNLKQIARISKGFAPVLTEILEEYLQQNTGGPAYRIQRIKAARQMLGVEANEAAK